MSNKRFTAKMIIDSSGVGLDSDHQFGDIVEILKGRLYFMTVDSGAKPKNDQHNCFFSVDNEVHYESFYTDFGPLNLSVLYRYCMKVQKKLKAVSKKRLIHYTSSDPQTRVNSAFLIGSFAMIYHGISADEVSARLKDAQPPKFLAFRDAAMGPATYDLHLWDVFKGVEKALHFGWLDFKNFDVEEYEYYERVESGDFNWIIPGKILAFCGPHSRSVVENGYPYHSPEVYFDYFKSHGVNTIIRLNRKIYDAKRFSQAGFRHIDLFFVDGSTPSDAIVLKFIEATDRALAENGGIAVHCKAGLGRTGTLIACWMMKEYGITAAECMAWIRICRPGSIIGPQQQFLIGKQKWCWSLKSRLASGTVSTLAENGDSVAAVGVSAQTSPSRHVQHKGQNNGGLNQLANKVDRLDLLHGKTKGASKHAHGADSEDEIKEDAAGRTQGDRLLQIKARRQHSVVGLQLPPPVHPALVATAAKFTSPTTPIKPVSSRGRHTGPPAAPAMRNLTADLFPRAVPGASTMAQNPVSSTTTTRQLEFQAGGGASPGSGSLPRKVARVSPKGNSATTTHSQEIVSPTTSAAMKTQRLRRTSPNEAGGRLQGVADPWTTNAIGVTTLDGVSKASVQKKGSSLSKNISANRASYPPVSSLKRPPIGRHRVSAASGELHPSALTTTQNNAVGSPYRAAAGKPYRLRPRATNRASAGADKKVTQGFAIAARPNTNSRKMYTQRAHHKHQQ